MRRAFIYIIFIIVTILVMFVVRLYCFENEYYVTLPLFITIVGMNLLLGLFVFKAGFVGRILVGVMVAVLVVGINYGLVIFATLSDAAVGPGLMLFALNIVFWELAIEIRKRSMLK
jgi:hypothetical protein